jgi:predicted 2-oxoglutarate/Fe(II)-dependent dioxygenase YbiX
LFVRRGFFDQSLCAALTDEISSAPSRPSTVAEKAEDAVDAAYRKTVSAQVSETTRASVEQRFTAVMPVVAEHFNLPLERLQPPQFLLYREGDYFRPHADQEDDAPEYVRERRVSAVVFLNGESDGGESLGSYSGGSLTFFGLMGEPRGDAVGFPLVGEAGLLVAFPSHVVHSVAPVTAGERFTIVGWFV